MPENNMSINSLLHAFPSVESYYDFKENDREISRRAIPGIIKYAFHHSIIETDSEAAFERDVVFRYKVRYFGGISALDSRWVTKIDGA